MIDVAGFLITPEILQIISEIDEFKGAWQLLGKLAPERLSALHKVATIESIGSSTRIEGAKLSDNEVEALLSRLNTHSFQSRDEQEVAGYALVSEEIFEGFESIPFTENTIKQFHGWLLQYSDKDVRYRGEYKKFPNHVEAFNNEGKSLGIVFETSTPFETPQKMEELVYWTREALETKLLHPLLITGIFVVVFLAIHPFQDGNGSLSRILTTLLLLKLGYIYVPYSSFESVIEANKESYYLALRKTQQTLKTDRSDWMPWILFFLRSMQKQKRLLEKKIVREKVISLQLSELSANILEVIQAHGRLHIRDLETITKAKRSTLKKHIQDLINSDQLVRHGKGRATWYTLP
ncbi:MAG: AsnC family transcriptional regulator [Alphaproteobacteria bacterium 41-28]|nr:MAG: AsnC family transcriptional regulator [Alphaproteobacteria bacterium 41-28]